MANIETQDAWHAPATIEEELLEYGDSETFVFEEQAPRSGFIVFVSLACLAFILFAMFGLYAYWQWYYDSTLVEQNLGRDSQMLLDLHNKENDQLNGGYKYINKEAGVVQLPIERAMQLILQEATEGSYRKGIPAATAAPAAAGAATTAPAGTQAAPAAPGQGQGK